MRGPAIHQNLIDKLITIVSPATGARRVQARQALAMCGAYTGARSDRRAMQNWITSDGSADADILMDLRSLWSRSRDLLRNAPLALGAVNTVVQNGVATGLSLQPCPDVKILGWTEDRAAEWSEKVEQEFALWAASKDCDATRTQDFYGLQELAFRSCLESGNTFTLLPFVTRKNVPYRASRSWG